MRKIKFRAWNKWEKRMTVGPHNGDFIKWHAASNWSDYLEVMQYTGLHDKNGVEIYEGDIVKVTSIDMTESIHKVAYRIDIDYPAFDLQPELVDDCNSLSFVCCAVDNEVEVIGNIYEHPDLLREQTCSNND